jgi:SOS response regulatory protein OraA/RecX
MALQRETGANHREEIRQDVESITRALEKLKKDLSKKRGELERKQDPHVRDKLLRFCLSRGFALEDALRILDIP